MNRSLPIISQNNVLQALTDEHAVFHELMNSVVSRSFAPYGHLKHVTPGVANTLRRALTDGSNEGI